MINQIITLGIGTPSGIEPFLLLGLHAEPAVVVEPLQLVASYMASVALVGSYATSLNVTGAFSGRVSLVASVPDTLEADGSLEQEFELVGSTE